MGRYTQSRSATVAGRMACCRSIKGPVSYRPVPYMYFWLSVPACADLITTVHAFRSGDEPLQRYRANDSRRYLPRGCHQSIQHCGLGMACYMAHCPPALEPDGLRRCLSATMPTTNEQYTSIRECSTPSETTSCARGTTAEGGCCMHQLSPAEREV